MAVPANPAVSSRALYFPYAVPAPVLTTYPPAGQIYTPSNMPPDIGTPGQPLPAIVLSVAGVTPDYSGMQLLVHSPDGSIVRRFAGFRDGQPMLAQATWVSNGSSALQARWVLVDALS
jgi:hypothetical protein